MLFEEENNQEGSFPYHTENDILYFHSQIQKWQLHHALIVPSFYTAIPELLKNLLEKISGQSVQTLQAPNIFSVCPNEHGNILMEDVRKAIEFAGKSTINAIEKFIIIHSFENISLNVANGLLKILEEPPESTFFILITREADLLLPTIKSRCLKINFPYSEKNFLFLCSFNKFWRENSGKLGEFISYNLSLLYLLTPEVLDCVQNLESIITREFNYLSFKPVYRKYRHLPQEIFFLILESIISAQIKLNFENISIVNLYFNFISFKKYVKLYNTNLELFLYCTIFNLCENIVY